VETPHGRIHMSQRGKQEEKKKKKQAVREDFRSPTAKKQR